MNMREKIARNAYQVLHGTKAPEDMSAPYASASKIGKAYKIADAALEALMEPTIDMAAAGFARNVQLGSVKRNPSDTFTAMIQAARDGA